MLLMRHMLCCQFVFESVLRSSCCYYCCFECCYYCIWVWPYASCCIGEYAHVLGVLVQGLLLSCVQLLDMGCCCMFCFGVAVAHVASCEAPPLRRSTLPFPKMILGPRGTQSPAAPAPTAGTSAAAATVAAASMDWIWVSDPSPARPAQTRQSCHWSAK